ncbi:MAG TPA: DUF4340 domain-containing protein [Polyangiaceae bacterium]|nr:DUF4340 domain-containing protein [Polyangiaceae bacterium]
MRQPLLVNGALVALALGTAALVWTTRDKPTTSELGERKKKLFAIFRKEDVSRISLRRAGEMLELERDPKSGDFRITRPWVERADAATVSQLLASLELASWLRAADGTTTEQAGLGSGAFVIELEMAGKRRQIRLGGAAPAPAGAHYAELQGEQGAERVVVSGGVMSELEVPFEKFRETRLLEYGRRELKKLSIQSPLGHVELEQREHGAFFTTMASHSELAQPAALERLFTALARVSSEHFVEPEAARAALGSDAVTVNVESTEPGAPQLTLRFAAQCPQAPELGLVLREEANKPPRAGCIASDVVSALRLGPDELRLDSAFAATPDAVEELSLGSGAQKLDLARKDKAWILRSPSQSELSLDAGNQRIVALLSAQGVRPTAGDAKDLGLEPPAGEAVIQVAGSDEASHREERVKLGQTRSDGSVCVERQLDGVRLCFDKASAAAFTADASLLRSPSVLHFAPSELASLTIDAGDLHERLLHDADGSYQLQEPHGFSHDGALVADAVQTLGTLQAVRWVAGTDQPRFGFDEPRLRASVQLVTGAPRELVVGASTEGGAFARLGPDPAIFVLSTLALADLRTPFIDRTLCPFARTELSRIELRLGPRSLVFTRTGEAWQAGGLPATQVAQLVDTLSALRAEQALHTGAAAKSEGFAKPSGSIAFTDQRGKIIWLFLGARGALGEEPIIYTRRDDVDATFALAARTAQDLEAF